MTEMIQIRRADRTDARRITQVLSAAFQDDPVSCWLIPDPDDRLRRHPLFFRVFLDQAITSGEVHITTDQAGVALWLEVDPDDTAQPAKEDTSFRDALGPAFDRFLILDEQMRAVHPIRVRHAFLPFIAVVPERQGRGVGRALLEHKLTQLDQAQVPAYLEASNARSGRLYQRLGFTRLPRDIPVPGGPSLYPMWRSTPG